MFAAASEGSAPHWLIMALAGWLIVAPRVLGYVNVSAATANDAAAGFLVIVCVLARLAAVRGANRANRRS
jgi:hypothetical protein